MKDLVNRASVWMYKQLPTAAETKKAAEVSSRYARETAKELQSVFVVGKSPGFMFVRLAGLSGAVAVAFGAYGAHGKQGQFVTTCCTLLSVFLLVLTAHTVSKDNLLQHVAHCSVCFFWRVGYAPKNEGGFRQKAMPTK